MNDKLTDSVARLHRAGSEHSQSTKKLRLATDMLLTWIKNNVPNSFVLPCGCQMYASGEFEKRVGSNSFKLTIGSEHTRGGLCAFSCLIGDGFLDALSKELEEESKIFESTAKLVDSFMASAKK